MVIATTDFGRLLRFLAAGVVNLMVGYGIYAVLVLVGLHPQPALAIAFVLGVLWNYMVHARMVFGTSGKGRLPRYAAVYAALYVFNAWALGKALQVGIHPLVAQAGLSVVMACLSFFAISLALTGEIPFFPSTRR